MCFRFIYFTALDKKHHRLIKKKNIQIVVIVTFVIKNQEQ